MSNSSFQSEMPKVRIN